MEGGILSMRTRGPMRQVNDTYADLNPVHAREGPNPHGGRDAFFAHPAQARGLRGFQDRVRRQGQPPWPDVRVARRAITAIQSSQPSGPGARAPRGAFVLGTDARPVAGLGRGHAAGLGRRRGWREFWPWPTVQLCNTMQYRNATTQADFGHSRQQHRRFPRFRCVFATSCGVFDRPISGRQAGNPSQNFYLRNLSILQKNAVSLSKK